MLFNILGLIAVPGTAGLPLEGEGYPSGGPGGNGNGGYGGGGSNDEESNVRFF